MEDTFVFSPEKNLKLKNERGISFEEVIAAINEGFLLDILEHPDQEKYGKQKIYVVHVKDYVYLVPHLENKDGSILLKTIIPSRKAKRTYLKGENEKN